MLAGIILVATLTPGYAGKPGELEQCVLCGERWLADLIRNVILFVPLGAAMVGALRRSPVFRVVLLASLFSALIELAQLFIPGRDPSVGDLLANSVGGMIGVLAVATARHWLTPSPRVAARLAVAAALVVAAAIVVTGALWSPALPASTFFVQWTPDLEHLQPYLGRVRASFLSMPAAPGADGAVRLLPDERTSRAEVGRLLNGPAQLTIEVTAGPPSGALAPVLAIHDQFEREILLLGPDQDDFVFRFRTLAVSLALDQPDLRVHGAMRPVVDGAALSIRVRRRAPGDYCIGLDSEPVCGNRFGLGSGWAALLFPRLRAEWMQLALDGIWLGLLVLPVGLWLRRGPWAAGAVAILCVSLGSAPFLGLRPAGFVELSAMACGVILGVMLARRARAIPAADTAPHSAASLHPR